MADNSVTLEINVDAKDATREIKNFGNQAENALKDVPKSADKAADSIENIGEASKKASTGFSANVKSIVAGLAVFEGLKVVLGSVTDFLKDSVNGAMESQVAFNELSQSLARAGTYTKENAIAFQEYAAELSRLSSIDDDVIVGQLAIARNFAQTDEQARRLVSAAADLSRAMGIDFGTAVEYLGKTLDGTAGRLTETVPALRGLSEESLKAGGAIEVVSKQFSGAALGYVKTYQGAIAQLEIQWGNYKEAIGDVVVGNAGIAAGINEVANIITGLTGDIEENKKTFQELTNQGIIALIDGIRALLPFINILATGFKAIWEIIKLVVGILSDAIIGLSNFILAVGDAIGYIATLGKEWSAFSDSFKDSSKLWLAFDTSEADSALKRIRDAIAGADLNAEVKIKNQDIKKIKDKIQVELKDLKVDLGGMAQIKEDIKSGQGPYGPFKEAYQFPHDNEKAFDLKDFEYGILKIFDSISKGFGPENWVSKDFAYEVSKNFAKEIGGQVVPPLEVIPQEIADAISKTGSLYGPFSNGYKLDESKIKYPELSFIDKLSKAFDDFVYVINYTSDTLGSGFDFIGTKIADFTFNEDPTKTKDENEKEKEKQGKIISQQIVDSFATPAKSAIAGAVAGFGTGVTSLIENIAGGQEGAAIAVADTLSASVGGALDSLLGTGGVFTDALKGILELATNPDAIAGLADSFISAIPTVVENFILSIPTIIQAIVAALPSLFQAVIQLIPVLFRALAESIPSLFATIGTYLPDLIVVLAENIPLIVEAIADNADIIIFKLVAAVPRIATALAFATVNVAVSLVTKLIPNVIKGISDGIGSWFKNADAELTNLLKGVLDATLIKPFELLIIKPFMNAVSFFEGIINTLSGKGASGPRFLTNTKEEVSSWFNVKKWKFATGGMVPQGYPNDSYPASLSSNELVLPPKTTGNLFNLIDSMAQGESPSGNNSETNALLRQLIVILSSQEKEINVQLDRNTLAKAILTLNKDNRRLA